MDHVEQVFDRMAADYHQLEPWYEHLYARVHAILREASHFGPRLSGAEAREAIAAIMEKRPPDFSKFT